MSISQSETKSLSKMDKIAKMQETAKVFKEETKQSVKLKANIPERVLFYADFYMDWQDLFNEAISQGKEPLDASNYAERNYRVKKKMEQDQQDPTRQYPLTTYKVTLPDSKYPDLVRELKLSSQPAIEKINETLAKIATEHDGKILLTIKKVEGETRWKTTWEVKGEPYLD